MKHPPIPEPLALPPARRTAYVPTNHALMSAEMSPSHYRSIGEVIVRWGRLENCLNDLTWTIQGKTLETGRTSTQDLQISRLLVALQNAMQDHLKGDRLKRERKAILNLIAFVTETKADRNLVVHGTWASYDGAPIVGSLKADTPQPDLVTFESVSEERLNEISNFAVQAVAYATLLIERIEASRRTP